MAKKIQASKSGAPDSERVLFIPDTHVPFHDAKALALVRSVIAEWRPHIVCILGDFADMYSISSHSRDPRRGANLGFELRQVASELFAVQRAALSAGAERLIYVEGNHEWRLERYMRDRAPELTGLRGLSFQEQVLSSEWEWVPYMSHTRIGKVYITHEVGFAGKYAVHHTGAAYAASVVFGHCHRLGCQYFGDAVGRTHVAAAMGWLGDAAEIGYGHEANKARDWQLGFGIGRLFDSGEMHVQCIPIVNGACVVEGKTYGEAVCNQIGL